MPDASAVGVGVGGDAREERALRALVAGDRRVVRTGAQRCGGGCRGQRGPGLHRCGGRRVRLRQHRHAADGESDGERHRPGRRAHLVARDVVRAVEVVPGEDCGVPERASNDSGARDRCCGVRLVGRGDRAAHARGERRDGHRLVQRRHRDARVGEHRDVARGLQVPAHTSGDGHRSDRLERGTREPEADGARRRAPLDARMRVGARRHGGALDRARCPVEVRVDGAAEVAAPITTPMPARRPAESDSASTCASPNDRASTRSSDEALIWVPPPTPATSTGEFVALASAPPMPAPQSDRAERRACESRRHAVGAVRDGAVRVVDRPERVARREGVAGRIDVGARV